MGLPHLDMWYMLQSRVGIEHDFGAYFDYVSTFEVL